jgi:hypothetical protein
MSKGKIIVEHEETKEQHTFADSGKFRAFMLKQPEGTQGFWRVVETEQTDTTGLRLEQMETAHRDEIWKKDGEISTLKTEINRRDAYLDRMVAMALDCPVEALGYPPGKTATDLLQVSETIIRHTKCTFERSIKAAAEIIGIKDLNYDDDPEGLYDYENDDDGNDDLPF